MIKDNHLREIVEKWGRREITSSMVKEAEKAKYNSFATYIPTFYNPGAYQNHLNRLAASQQSQRPFGYQGFLGGGGSLLGGRCPCCGS